jgi:hypothetical protein
MIKSGNVSAANAELATVQTAISAAMANALVSKVTGTTISSGADINPPVNPYIAGGRGTLKGTYTINTADGSVSSGIYPELTWDGTIHQFK